MRRSLFLTLFLPVSINASRDGLHGPSDEGQVALSPSAFADPHSSFIIVFKEGTSRVSISSHLEWLNTIHLKHESMDTDLQIRAPVPGSHDHFGGVKHTFDIGGIFLGYSGQFDPHAMEQVARSPDVASIERDSEIYFENMDEVQEQKTAPWGLARISHREALNESTMSHYLYSENGGRGVDIYVPDTGINICHVDFEGRAYWSTTIPADLGDTDHHGHGTHCSGTMVGKKYGVAKKARVFAIKISEPDSYGRGRLSDGLKGIEWAVNAHAKNVSRAMKSPNTRKKFKGSVMNISFASGQSPAFNAALNAAVDTGMHVAVAAGNDNYDACKRSPASAQKPVSVGASNFTDELAWFSNHGPCVDIFAPGVDILSPWIGSKNATQRTSGTSIASPHVAGLLAYLLSLQPDPDSQYAMEVVTPKKLKDLLVCLATRDVLSKFPPDTKNLLAWNGAGKSNLSAL